MPGQGRYGVGVIINNPVVTLHCLSEGSAKAASLSGKRRNAGRKWEDLWQECLGGRKGRDISRN